MGGRGNYVSVKRRGEGGRREAETTTERYLESKAETPKVSLENEVLEWEKEGENRFTLVSTISSGPSRTEGENRRTLGRFCQSEEKSCKHVEERGKGQGQQKGMIQKERLQGSRRGSYRTVVSGTETFRNPYAKGHDKNVQWKIICHLKKT